MIVALLPLEIKEASPRLNTDNVIELSRHVRDDASLMVLPELFSTGFLNDEATFELLAEPLDGETMQRLQELSAKRNMAIAGGFLCRDDMDGSLRNRAFFINPDDDYAISYYDKHHLFTISRESKIFKAGDQSSPIVRFRDWNIALSICFDIRFPVWNRNVDNRYDMVVVPANWPDSRFNAWQSLLKARAIENMAVYVGCNRSGIDRFGIYSYMSSFGVDERGEVIAEIHGNTPLRHATFNLEKLLEFRKKFPVFELADKFSLH